MPRFGEPDIGRYLLRDEGEVIVDVVRKHYVVYLRPLAQALVGAALLVSLPFVRPGLELVPLALAVGLLVHAVWLYLSARMDVFVITNMRVFRVNGVLSRKQATMPLIRILDITVVRSLLGRLLGYGHFVFESAAQEQGLKEIRFVGRPGERDLAIQRVVQRSGLRGPGS
ncbi:MAG: PH domain-containing protein [Nocardioides sp.]